MAILRKQADMQKRKRVPNGTPNADRIKFYARPDDQGCWRWTGYISPDGYGTVRDTSGRTRRAHRVAYESWVGPIPESLHLDHLCRVRDCCNPAHLEPVTARENTLRGTTIAAAHAATTHCPRNHEYTPENTYSSSRGERDCRACRRRRGTEWARKKRAELGRRGGLVRIG